MHCNRKENSIHIENALAELLHVLHRNGDFTRVSILHPSHSNLKLMVFLTQIGEKKKKKLALFLKPFGNLASDICNCKYIVRVKVNDVARSRCRAVCLSALFRQ